MQARITVLAGDGIGPDVTREAVRVLEAVSGLYGHELVLEEAPFGGIAIDRHGDPFPDHTQALCERSDAVLLGAVGGPRWSDPQAAIRPEQGLLQLRSQLGLFSNLRPVQVREQLAGASPLKMGIVRGVDLLVVRELTGGIYFGPREEGTERAFDTMLYTRPEIERVVRVAAGLAQERRGYLVSVDKANVLASSRLWRRVVDEVLADEFPSLRYEHYLVDAMAMHLVRRPADFDVVVTANMFGDILTDEASTLAGSLGMLPSASLGERLNRLGMPLGVFEPIHGSAPDIAGRGIANPLAAILSAAMLLRHSLGWVEAASRVESAVDQALAGRARTVDILGESQGEVQVGTQEMGDLVLEALSGGPPAGST